MPSPAKKVSPPSRLWQAPSSEVSRKLSGDGVAGFTRAFFCGDTPSVIGTLWDVGDEPTSQFVFNFYSALQKDHDKSRALRTAQMWLIRAIRAGRVRVYISLGPVMLPEDPVFWDPLLLELPVGYQKMKVPGMTGVKKP